MSVTRKPKNKTLDTFIKNADSIKQVIQVDDKKKRTFKIKTKTLRSLKQLASDLEYITGERHFQDELVNEAIELLFKSAKYSKYVKKG